LHRRVDAEKPSVFARGDCPRTILRKIADAVQFGKGALYR